MGDLAGRWNADPVLLLVLAAGLMLASRLPAGRRSAGIAGIGVLGLAFLSPLCAAGVALFSARAVHHLLIVGAAAALLAKAWPVVRGPGMGIAFVGATATLWAWHVPGLYDAALANKTVYWLMQGSLLATAWLYWLALFRREAPVALAGIVAGAAQMGLLGAILTFAPRPLYASHLSTTIGFGIGPLADQQLAGLIMWVVGLIPYAVVALHTGRNAWTAMGRT